jgi:hypothetical protein
MSPTARSLAHLRQLGYVVKVVERWNPYSKRRKDLFGCDVLALKPGEPVLMIQCTSGSHHAARRCKLTDNGFRDLWTSCGVALEVWSWRRARIARATEDLAAAT